MRGRDETPAPKAEALTLPLALAITKEGMPIADVLRGMTDGAPGADFVPGTGGSGACSAEPRVRLAASRDGRSHWVCELAVFM